MLENLVKWANNNKDFLEVRGIKTEKVFINEHGAHIDHATKNCIGRIAFTINGDVDIEILEIESSVRLMCANYAFQSDFFEDLITSYIRILQTSTKQIQSKYHTNDIKKVD